MAKGRGDFTDILIKSKILSAEQLDEARSIANSQGAKLQDVLIKQNYADHREVMSAIAEFHGLAFVDLDD